MNQEQREFQVWRCTCGAENGHDHTFCAAKGCNKLRWSQFGLSYRQVRGLVGRLYAVDAEKVA